MLRQYKRKAPQMPDTLQTLKIHINVAENVLLFKRQVVIIVWIHCIFICQADTFIITYYLSNYTPNSSKDVSERKSCYGLSLDLFPKSKDHGSNCS